MWADFTKLEGCKRGERCQYRHDITQKFKAPDQIDVFQNNEEIVPKDEKVLSTHENIIKRSREIQSDSNNLNKINGNLDNAKYYSNVKILSVVDKTSHINVTHTVNEELNSDTTEDSSYNVKHDNSKIPN